MSDAFLVLLQDFVKQLGIEDYQVDPKGCELGLDNDLKLSIFQNKEETDVMILAEILQVPPEKQQQLMMLMLQSNLLWTDTNGFTFALDEENTIILQHKLPLQDLLMQTLYDNVENLVQAASVWKEQFEKLISDTQPVSDSLTNNQQGLQI